ncbi:MAG: transporter [Nostocales cyanobacterium]|nr:MAG: transporter [Nostocales cyanobacterium]TAF16829.1 MAG: transporter [Nostocales cyanobacterium]
MNDLLVSIITGVVAFGATNIDDLLILLVFFAQVDDNFRPWQVVLGQYLGFTVLIILSLPGLFGGLILPANLIGLLGLIPIAIGINILVNYEVDISAEILPQPTPNSSSNEGFFFNTNIYTVAIITVANGSDNISIYIPLFSSIKLDIFFIILALYFCLLMGLCYVGYKLTHQRKIAQFLTEYGSYFVPFVLMGLGVVIIYKSQALGLVKLLAICICLFVLIKKNN